ncbi:MAG: hypothetical protein Q8M92_00220 [Candidatus Subteraquimicrobiales bacterium]|nr:hypothetical protein [Candidatus Subteraquimicrobiales bacterium]
MRFGKRQAKWLTSAFLALVFLVSFASVVSANEPVLSGDLVEKAKFFDGKTVVFQGEVIGDVMIRGDFAWINVNDDVYSEGAQKLSGYNSGQSVWCKASEAKLIKTTGDYGHIGDIVEVVGIFNRACPEHGGDMDIHAEKIRIVKSGYQISHFIEPTRIWICLILFIVSLFLFALGRFLRYKRVMGEKTGGFRV